MLMAVLTLLGATLLSYGVLVTVGHKIIDARRISVSAAMAIAIAIVGSVVAVPVAALLRTRVLSMGDDDMSGNGPWHGSVLNLVAAWALFARSALPHCPTAAVAPN